MKKKSKQGATAYFKRSLSSVAAAPWLFAGCLTLLAGSAFAIGAETRSYLGAFGLSPTFEDGLVWLFASQRGIPYLWCVCPAALMIWLVASGSSRRRASWFVRHRNARQLWLEDLADALFGAVVFSVAALLSACAASALLFTPTDASAGFGLAHSVFQAVTGKALQSPPATIEIMAVSSMLGFLVLAVTGTFFQLGKLAIGGPVAPFFALVVLGLPTVHGSQTFLLEAAALLGLPLDPKGPATNPLSLPYEVSSVFYDSWLPESGHGLWLQGALLGIAIACGLALAPHKDRLQA